MIVLMVAREKIGQLTISCLVPSSFIYMGDAVLQKAAASPIYFGEFAKMLKDIISAEVLALELFYWCILSDQFQCAGLNFVSVVRYLDTVITMGSVTWEVLWLDVVEELWNMEDNVKDYW